MNLHAVQAWKQYTAQLQRVSAKRWFYPVALLLIGLLAYAYQLGALGFYWDDWEVVFLLNTRATSLLYGYFAFDRPFAWPYQLMYALFGLNPIAWHLVTLLLRWGGILLFYLSLRATWPRLDGALRWLGALLVVYPGFFQQSISAAYNRHFVAFLLFMLSIYLMVLAVKQPGKAWWLFPLSWITAFIQVFTIEYFVGLELIRPLLLWFLLADRGHESRWKVAQKVFIRWLPYAAAFAFYFWWRLAVFPTTLNRLNYAGDFKMLEDFQGGFVGGVLALLTRGFFDLLYSTLQVWVTGLTGQDGFTFQSKAVWFALILGAVVAGTCALFQKVSESSEENERESLLPIFLLGGWAFVAGSMPVWLTSKQLSAGGRWDDRFALSMMLGAGLLTLAVILWLIRPSQRKLVLGLMLTFAVATQALVVNRFRLDWQTQRDYYWQLSWRAPALEPHTAILSFEQPSAMMPGYDTSFALNVLYDGSVSGDGLTPYWFFTNDRFLKFQLVPGKPISYGDRNLLFKGSTSEAISVVHQGEGRCLQVLDAAYTGQPFYEADQEQLIAVSNVQRIVAEAKNDPPNPLIFGAEPEHGWCYYFEKADLARQMQDWQTVLQLEKQAKAGGLAAKFGPEYVPFIEAHAQTGDWLQALKLGIAANEATKEMQPLLCQTWARLGKLPAADLKIVGQANQTFACTTP